MNHTEARKVVHKALTEIFRERLVLVGCDLDPSGFVHNAMAIVEAAYGEEHRRYHNLPHIGEMLLDAQLLATVYEFPLSPDEWDQLRFAIIWHDFLYDPTFPTGANENGSAYRAVAFQQECNRIAQAQLFSDSFQKRTMHLINLTIDHIADEGDIVARILCDCDLLRFAAPYPAFVQNNEDIRFEYKHVSDEDWQKGRGAVMLKYLLRDPFFYVAGDDCVDKATLNIVRHMRELNAS